MTDENETTQGKPGATDAREEQVDVSRRRLGRAAAATVPLYLALRSRSVRAAVGNGVACVGPSGFNSLNVSNLNRPTTCQGRSPGYWLNHPDQWAATGYSPGACVEVDPSTGACHKYDGGTTFVSVFGTPTIWSPSNIDSLTLMQCLMPNSDGGQRGPNNMAFYFVGALLNAAADLTPALPKSLVLEMASQYFQNGYYMSPPPGGQWYAATIKSYFESTWV